MNFRRLLVLCAVLIVGGTGLSAHSAHARHIRWVHRTRLQCVDAPLRFSLHKLLFGTKPQPNGCAPPVFSGADYIGQDPDPYIRSQLLRDPDTGYTPQH